MDSTRGGGGKLKLVDAGNPTNCWWFSGVGLKAINSGPTAHGTEKLGLCLKSPTRGPAVMESGFLLAFSGHISTFLPHCVSLCPNSGVFGSQPLAAVYVIIREIHEYKTHDRPIIQPR